MNVSDEVASQPDLRVAVLASGEGSNLQAIIDTVHERRGVKIVRVVSDKPDAKALERAADAEIPTAVFELQPFLDEGFLNARVARDSEIAKRLTADRVDLVVLAGFMQILSSEFIAAFNERIINVHPSLLPKYPGLRAIDQALDAGDSQTGVTVHFVDEGVDTGPVIEQETVDIAPGESIESLTERIHRIEHRLLPEVIARIAAERTSG